MVSNGAVWAIAFATTAGVVVRPWRLPEAVWAVAGALALVGAGLLRAPEALAAIGKGTDVYLFLIGMMLIAELARREGLFDHLAALAAGQAQGSGPRLFGLVYAVGIVVTTFLSNDATAVVLTPAVYAAARAANAKPLPYLYVCAFIANAAGFMLPISNPANLVVFRDGMPPLAAWLRLFALPSCVAIAATYLALRLALAGEIAADIEDKVETPPLSRGGKFAASGIALAAVVLLIASALGWALGLPTCVLGIVVAGCAHVAGRKSPVPLLRGVSWSVLPLVAGLFVIVEALARTGAVDALASPLQAGATRAPELAGFVAGAVVATAANLMNNLPAGLLAAAALAKAQASEPIKAATLIGIDLGPNISVTGSLATILWLVAIRREGLDVSAWRFLRLGLIVTPPALVAALAACVLLAPA